MKEGQIERWLEAMNETEDCVDTEKVLTSLQRHGSVAFFAGGVNYTIYSKPFEHRIDCNDLYEVEHYRMPYLPISNSTPVDPALSQKKSRKLLLTL